MATLNELGGKFQVEEGRGGERDEKLKEYKIQTYLIIPPKQTVRYVRIPGSKLIIAIPEWSGIQMVQNSSGPEFK